MRSDVVRMSNQIAANFAHHAPEVAAKEVANHLRMFWPPTMRAELLAQDDHGALDPLVLAAIVVLRDAAAAS